MQAERIPRAKFCCCCLALCFGVKMPSFCGRILPFFLWCVRASGVVFVGRRAVRVFAAVHRWKIVGVSDTKFCLRAGFSAPRGAGISLPVIPFFCLVCDSPLFGGGLSFHLPIVFFPEVTLGSPGRRNFLFFSFRLLPHLKLCWRRDAVALSMPSDGTPSF